MENSETQEEWDLLSHDEKKRLLYLKQKKTLDTFLANGAISKAQYDKSLHDLTEKMGYGEPAADPPESH